MATIIHIPNKVLTFPARRVHKIDKKVHRLIADMKMALDHQEDPPGVGLAAPQVGATLRLFIMKPEEDGHTTVHINPTIVKKEGAPAPLKKPVRRNSPKARKTDDRLEGCLSIPRIWAPVARYPKILLSYQDEHGKTHEKWYEGFEAIIVQHEVDHLDGVLFTKRALEQQYPIYEEHGDKLEKITDL